LFVRVQRSLGIEFISRVPKTRSLKLRKYVMAGNQNYFIQTRILKINEQNVIQRESNKDGRQKSWLTLVRES
jgi:hypothetical protein